MCAEVSVVASTNQRRERVKCKKQPNNHKNTTKETRFVEYAVSMCRYAMLRSVWGEHLISYVLCASVCECVRGVTEHMVEHGWLCSPSHAGTMERGEHAEQAPTAARSEPLHAETTQRGFKRRETEGKYLPSAR